MSILPLNALRAFEAVARLGSFKAAADSLFVTQSAISHHVYNVEKWLGKPLFLREGNRTRLLADGSDGVTVDGAKVIQADIAADNGIIHVIDTVMLPSN